MWHKTASKTIRCGFRLRPAAHTELFQPPLLGVAEKPTPLWLYNPDWSIGQDTILQVTEGDFQAPLGLLTWGRQTYEPDAMHIPWAEQRLQYC